MEPGWFALIALAFLVVIVLNVVGKKLKSLAPLHPNSVLRAINDAGGSANLSVIAHQLETSQDGMTDLHLRALEKLLTVLEEEGKVTSRSTGFQVLAGQAPITVYTLTDDGRASLATEAV